MTAQGPIKNLGTVGQQLAENVRRARGTRTYRQLADRLTELGRPIPVLGLSRIEAGARRVDVDDLVALAAALDVAPAALLLPPEDPVSTPGPALIYVDPRGRTWRLDSTDDADTAEMLVRDAMQACNLAAAAIRRLAIPYDLMPERP